MSNIVIISCFVLIIASILAIFSAWPFWNRLEQPCNVANVAQRDFYRYYGLSNIDNPLAHRSADQGNNINTKCILFYDYMHILPTNDLQLPKSMIIQAVRGAGKTQIRQCIIARLPRNNHILIKIYGVDVNNYLDNFIKNIHFTPELPYEKIQKYWRNEHFLQVILTELASHFINMKYLPNLLHQRETLSSETRKEIATLLSFYSTKDPDTLCKMVNLLLFEVTECWLYCNSIPCDNYEFTKGDQEMFISLTERHRKITVKRQTTATDVSLRILSAVHTKTKFSPLACLDRSYLDQLTILINLLSALHIPVTIIVDSLDESAFFFDKADSNLSGLQTFVDSMTNDDIMHLALNTWGGDNGIHNSFSFYIFIPKTSTVTLKISWTRQDKIPIIDFKWDKLQLINYVDYVFDYLRDESKHQCKPLPNIYTLLGGKDLCIHFMSYLRHPRDFHIFFNILTYHLGTVCTQRDPPFVATEEDLQFVWNETQSRILIEKIN